MRELTILLMLFVSMLSLRAETKTGSCGTNVTYTLDTETGVLTISGNGAMKDYYYGMVDHYEITTAPWREYASNLTSAVIEDGVTSIGNSAFYGCSGLTSVTIGNSVTSIGDYAFENCSGLITSVTIPNSVTRIGIYAFYNCSNLTSVTIGNSVTSIGSSAFYNCSGLTSVTIPNSVTSIGDRAFDGCSHITTPIIVNKMFVKLPQSFVDHYSIPNGIEQIIGGAFRDCSGLTSVTIPNSVTRIGNFAFDYCYGLTSVDIPNSVTSIGSSAFRSCYGLTSVTIPNSVTSIGDKAFTSCSSLTSVTIPNSVTSIGRDLFSSCSRISDVVWNASRITTQDIFPYSSYSLRTITIGDDINVILPIFSYPRNIETISIGKNVTQIRAEAFGDCANLQSVTSYAKEPPFCYPNAFKNLKEGTILTVYASCAEAYRNADTWKDFTIVTMPDPRDGMLAELETLYEEYKDYTFKAGTEEGQYGKDEVKAFNAAKFEASNILTDDSDYTDEDIQQALEELKRSYEAVVASKVEGITIADATALSVSEEKNYQALTYTRNFKNTNWQPLYVPFSMSYEDWASQGLEVARLNGFYEYDDNLDGKIDRSALEVLKVTATEGNLKPNHPYMVRATTTGEKTIVVNNAKLYPTVENSGDCSTFETKYTFTGTYSTIASAELTAMGAYVLGGGALGQSTSNLNPMRWYMVRESRGGQLLPALQSIKVYVYGEDEADAIDFTYDNEAEGEAYNLMGQKVSSNQKGIVIRNGKKFVNK